MAKNDILADAIADAKRVKATALANAKFALEETFQPTLQRMISSRIQEEEGEEDEQDIDIDVNLGGEDEYAPEGEEESIGFGSFEDEEEAPEEGGEDLELESLIRELDGEEDYSMDESDDYEDLDEGDEFDDEMLEGMDFDELEEGEEDEWSSENPSADWGDSMAESDEFEDEMSSELQEALNSLLEEEGLGDMLDMGQNKEDGSVYTDHSLPTNSALTERRKLRSQNKKLKRDLNEAYRAVTTLKKTLNEVNLLNAKLMFTTKTFKQYNLTESQQSRILDSFDRANNVREVKLVYTTICESFNKKPLSKKKITEGFASKSVNAINPSRRTSNTDVIAESMKDRFQRLANLKDRYND